MSDRRTAILDASVRLLEGHGSKGLTMRGLAEQMGFTPPILYDHFAGKAELLAAIADYGFSELASSFDDDPELPPASRLENLFRKYVEFGLSRPDLYDVMHSRPVGALKRSPHAQDASRVLTSVIAATGTTPERWEARAKLVWASLHGIVSLMRVGMIEPGTDLAAALTREFLDAWGRG